MNCRVSCWLPGFIVCVQWNFKSYIYNSRRGNVIFFCFYKRWIKWILFLLVMIEFSSFRRHFLSLLSNPNKTWPLWSPGHLVCWNTRLNTFQGLCWSWSPRVCSRGAWGGNTVADEMCFSWNLCPTVACCVIEWMLTQLTQGHLGRSRQVPWLFACFPAHFFLNCSRGCKCQW